MAKIYIVIPTYNEKDNIGRLIAELFALKIAGLHILVVDDNSPDGTGQLIEELKVKFPQLAIIHRQQKAGLGPAYVAGFKAALAQGADYIFEMDADFSHSPRYIPDFLQAIADYDLVLGSRYIKGGGVTNWNFIRRLISRWGNVYARLILGLPFQDLTGGFKCYHRRVLEQINLTNLSSAGYNFQIETTYKAHQAGFRIKEIPIVFTERLQGKSKFAIKIILESFWRVLLLRFNRRDNQR